MVSQKGSPTLQLIPASVIDRTVHGDSSRKGEKASRSWPSISCPDVLKDKNKNSNIVFRCIELWSPESASYDIKWQGTLRYEHIPQGASKDLLESHN